MHVLGRGACEPCHIVVCAPRPLVSFRYDVVVKNILPEKFSVHAELGSGGTSVVYAARDLETERMVAVKLLVCDEESRRFRLEAHRIANLSHPNVVCYLEVGQHNDRDFLVMECLPKGDLDEAVEGLSIREKLELFLKLCDGLEYLHTHGIVHRDIKPSNILFDQNGEPKIADLGLARHVDENLQLTQTGSIVGSCAFMSPEQILSSKVGPSADLYSLGVCLFKALTGENPFQAKNDFAMLKAHLQDEPPSLREYLPDASPQLVGLVKQLLAKDPVNRPETAGEVARRLLDCLDVEVSEAQIEGQFEELGDRERSLLLILCHLGPRANFENVCALSAFPADSTERALIALEQSGYLRADLNDVFSLKIPASVVRPYLTPRLQRLYDSRLARYSERYGAKTAEPVWLAESTVEDFDFESLASMAS